jgi:hypothetical protein
METETTVEVSGQDVPELGNISSTIVEKHRKPRSDAGKPRGPRNKAATNEPSNQASVPAALETVDITAVRKGVSSLFRSLDALLTRKTYRTALFVSDNDETFSRNIAADVSMPKEENELISELTASVCQRHELLGRFAPETLLIIALGSYGTRVMVAFKKLNDIAATQAELLKEKNK